jgi:hypothetical protein
VAVPHLIVHCKVKHIARPISSCTAPSLVWASEHGIALSVNKNVYSRQAGVRVAQDNSKPGAATALCKQSEPACTRAKLLLVQSHARPSLSAFVNGAKGTFTSAGGTSTGLQQKLKRQITDFQPNLTHKQQSTEKI